MFTLLCAISIQILKFFCKDRRLLLYMSRTLHLFGTDWCAMMVPIQVIRWYRMQCYDGTDSCATVVPIRRYCHIRDIRDFSFIIDCQQINDNEFFRSVWLKLPERAISTIHKRYHNCSGPNVNAWQIPVAPLTFPLQESLSSDRLSFLPYLQQNR